ncbi:FAD-binding oxidoreductase [Novosphingobium sp. LASN5T]|uniref:NAD(P)/FAD-dependent oxidoreductase n=1 Tax=Novosphingobium sp. LASN5T TaxID=2491021 RepID=UPI001CC1DC8A|nr:FAD-binding oxidoreductase [Novosphingobium sp. LASN5T]
MESPTASITTSDRLPRSASVVIIGGGIVGLTAALTLSERGVQVVVLEKGSVAGEQSSRNQGWIRKTSRAPADVPLAAASDRLWAGLAERVGSDVGYRQAGILFLAKSEAEMHVHEKWLQSVEQCDLDSRLLTLRDIDHLVPGGRGDWAGGIYTPSDGRAEPSLAAYAIARAARAKGAIILENCAVRSLVLSGSRVTGAVTEHGEIRSDAVLLAGGLWSRRFLGNLGVDLPTLPLTVSVARTAPMEGPTEIAVGGPDFSFRKHADGGFIVTQRSAVKAPITLDHLLIGQRYISSLKTQGRYLRVSIGREFFQDLALPRRWKPDARSPFERVRTKDPAIDQRAIGEAFAALSAAWPVFEQAEIVQTWAGTVDVTPDSTPVIDHVSSIPGLTVCTGFSGHGFGTSPTAGELAADLITGADPIIDPSPYRFRRFAAS